MVSFNAIIALISASAVATTSYAAPMRAVTDALNVRAEPVSEMAVGRDGLDLMEKKWIENREIINPKITFPTANTVWIAGEKVEVIWDTSVISGQFADKKGSILLGYEKQGDEGYHLNVENPLADGFMLSKGSQSFTLPSKLTTKHSYFVVLLGDSGNKSPNFTIKAASASQAGESNSTP